MSSGKEDPRSSRRQWFSGLRRLGRATQSEEPQPVAAAAPTASDTPARLTPMSKKRVQDFLDRLQATNRNDKR